MNIILYSTGCPRCNILKSELENWGIPYTENNDIEKMKSLGILSAPYLSVDGTLYDYANSLSRLREISYKVED